MSLTNKPDDEAFTKFWERVCGSKQWPGHCTMFCPGGVHFVKFFRELYPVLAPAGRVLPNVPVRWTTCDTGEDSLEEAYLTPGGDGVVAVGRHRGFMPGMGQTLTYFLVVGDGLCVEVQDYWEDNIADPESATFQVRAGSEQDLKRATCALESAIAALIQP